MTCSVIGRVAALCAAAVIGLAPPPAARAQQPGGPQDTTHHVTPRRTKPPRAGAVHRVQTLEIRAQVPVPQVVTVRPRVVPAFRAEALDSALVDEHFWTALRAPYQAVPVVAPVPASSSPPVLPSPSNVPPKER
jgi:hypothetical protein